MQGYFRFKQQAPDSWDYYFNSAVNVHSHLQEWGLVRVYRHHHYVVLRDPVENFPGEGALVTHFGLKYLFAHLFRNQVTEEVYFDN